MEGPVRRWTLSPRKPTDLPLPRNNAMSRAFCSESAVNTVCFCAASAKSSSPRGSSCAPVTVPLDVKPRSAQTFRKPRGLFGGDLELDGAERRDLRVRGLVSLGENQKAGAEQFTFYRIHRRVQWWSARPRVRRPRPPPGVRRRTRSSFSRGCRRHLASGQYLFGAPLTTEYAFPVVINQDRCRPPLMVEGRLRPGAQRRRPIAVGAPRARRRARWR